MLTAALRRGQPNCHDHGVESATSKPRAREEREPATVAAEQESGSATAASPNR